MAKPLFWKNKKKIFHLLKVLSVVVILNRGVSFNMYITHARMENKIFEIKREHLTFLPLSQGLPLKESICSLWESNPHFGSNTKENFACFFPGCA